MQTAHCSCCGSKLPEPRQAPVSLRKSRQGPRLPASTGNARHQQRKRPPSTLTYSHKEDGDGSQKSGTDRGESPEKSKQQRLDALHEQMERLQSSLRQKKRKLSPRERLAKEWKAVSSWVPVTVGVPGCMALAAGYLLHLDPYGQLHWSSHDALVGLACAAPTLLTDFGLMVPNFSDRSTQDLESMVKRREAVLAKLKAGADKSTQDLESMVKNREALLNKLKEGVEASQDQIAKQSSSSASSSASASEQPSSVDDDAKGIQDSDAASKVRIIKEKLLRLQQASEHGPNESISGLQINQNSLRVPVSVADSSKDTKADWEASKQSLIFAALKRMTAQKRGPGLLRETLKASQRRYVLQNPGLELHPAVEALVILVSHLADEMLLRAILLAGLSGWVTDRLFEAGGEDLLPGFASATMSVPDTGKWTALAMLAGFEVGKAAANVSLLSRGSFKVMGLEKAMGFNKPAQDIPTKKARDEKKAEVMGLLKKVTKKMEKRRHGEIIVSAGRKVLALASFGGSFILTGNLLAPYIGAVSCDFLFSQYQRAKHGQLVTGDRIQFLSRKEWQSLKEAKNSQVCWSP